MVFWITGRAGAGKTTLALKMAREFKDNNRPVLILDGDDVRDQFKDRNFDRRSRWDHISKISHFATIAEKQGIIVIIALVSPEKFLRQHARLYFQHSQLIYITGGTMWAGTKYEEPDEEEAATVRKGYSDRPTEIGNDNSSKDNSA